MSMVTKLLTLKVNFREELANKEKRYVDTIFCLNLHSRYSCMRSSASLGFNFGRQQLEQVCFLGALQQFQAVWLCEGAQEVGAALLQTH